MHPLGSPFGRKPQRRGFSFGMIIAALILPWMLFEVSFFLMSFRLHYDQGYLCYSLCAAVYLIVIYFGYSAHIVSKKKEQGDLSQQPHWWVFLFATGLLACGSGLVIGDMNYTTNMYPYYDINTLANYSHVNPSIVQGNQFMDAGMIGFIKSAYLNITQSLGFKNKDIYCVAPIVAGDSQLRTYDFWAVGVNCCSGRRPDFHCGEYDNPDAHSGFKLMSDDQKPFFRLAVQQAEAFLAIKVSHPVFLTWMQEPDSAVEAYQEAGTKVWVLTMFCALGIQMILVCVAAIVIQRST